MKILAQEEYGLRILLRIARADQEEGLSIAQLSEDEGLSTSYVAKLTRQLRLAGLLQSTRGQKGGYVLARPADKIIIKDVLHILGGPLFDLEFCNNHSGAVRLCTNSVDCSARSLWRMVQITLDTFLARITLQDLLSSEKDAGNLLQQMMEEQLAIQTL